MRRLILAIAFALCLTQAQAEPSVSERLFGQYAAVARAVAEWGGTVLLCLLGGFVMWVDDRRKGTVDSHTWWFLAGKLGGSSVSGLIVFLMLKAHGTDPYLAGALAGVAGMAGAEWVRQGLVRRLNRAIGIETARMPLDDPAKTAPGALDEKNGRKR